MRKTTLLWLVLAVFCGTGIFHTSQKVHDERVKIETLNASIAKEEESLRVLNAEWSYLNQPTRLEKLTKTYLHLAPLKGTQFVKVEDIPLRKAKVAQITPPAEEKTAVKKPEEKEIAGKKIPEKKAVEKKIVEKKTVKPQIVALRRTKYPSPDPPPAGEGTEKLSLSGRRLDEGTTTHGVKAASTHSFADLMKNLRSGAE